jgi:hypothetical protein
MFKMYRSYTSCIRSKNINAIAEALTHLMEREKGCKRLSQLPELSFDPKQLHDLKIQDRPRLFIIGLFCGEEDWTIVKTYPAEFLCTRKTNSDRPRLSELAMQLKCDAFHYRVVYDSNGILMEANSPGRICVSGWKHPEADDRYRFYREKFNEPGSCPEFSLLEVSESIQAAMLVNEDPEIEIKEDEYRKHISDSDPVDPDEHLQILIALEEIVLKGYGERIDLALAKILDPSASFWNEAYTHQSIYGDLISSVYLKAEELEHKGVKLLYFQSPDSYDYDIHRYQ